MHKPQWNLMLRVAALLAAGIVTATMPHVAQADAPLRLTFDKVLVDPAGIWEGTVAGDIEGDLTTVLLSARAAGPNIVHVEFHFIITPEGSSTSFTIYLKGVLDTRRGTVIMNGVVLDGPLAGARVHEAGQLVDPATVRFQGTIRIM